MGGHLHPKLSVPRQGMVLDRPRLRAALKPVLSEGIAAVIAGPGYGKTALISDIAASEERPVVYMGLDAEDRDPSRFTERLADGLEAALPGFRRDTEGRGSLGHGDDPDAGELIMDLLEGVSAAGGSGGLIIMDDLHEVGGTETGRGCIRLLAERLPSGWSLLLVSREPLPFPLEVPEICVPVVHIGSRTLRLTPSEVVAWAREIWGVELQLPEARSLWRVTEGWPAALVLLGQHTRSGSLFRRREDLRMLLRKGRRLNDYLAGEVLAHMPQEVVGVLRVASPLPRVVFPRDQALFAGTAADAEEVLAGLVARGFFLMETGNRVYQLHPLVKAYVRREMEKEDPEGAQALMDKSARHLEAVGELREAVVLFLRCGEPERAVAPLKKLARSHLNANHTYIAPEWLDHIPEDLMEEEPWLRFAQARVLQGKGQFAEAEVLYGSVAAGLKAEGDVAGYFQALTGRGFCLYALGRWEESLHVLSRAEKVADTPRERAEIMGASGNVLLSLCRWDEAVDRWEMALASAGGEQRKALEARIMVYRVRLFYLLGQYQTAAAWAKRAVRLGSRRVPSTYAAALNAAATVLCSLGRYEDAAMHADAAGGLVDSRDYVFLKPAVQLSLGAIAFGREEVHKGLEHVEKAKELARKANDVESEVWALGMLGDLFRRNRNPERALQHHRRAEEMAGEQPLARYEAVKASCAVGMDLVVQGDLEGAEEILKEVVSAGREGSLLGPLVQGQFYRSWLLARQGEEKAAGKASGEAMRLAAEHGHIDFLVEEARAATPILALADRYGHGEFLRTDVVPLLPSYLASYFKELAEGNTYPVDVGLGHPKYSRISLSRRRRRYPSDVDEEIVEKVRALTPREQEILEMLGEGLPNKTIATRLFITEKTIKTHTHRIYRKLEVANRLQAALAFQQYQKAVRAVG